MAMFARYVRLMVAAALCGMATFANADPLSENYAPGSVIEISPGRIPVVPDYSQAFWATRADDEFIAGALLQLGALERVVQPQELLVQVSVNQQRFNAAAVDRMQEILAPYRRNQSILNIAVRDEQTESVISSSACTRCIDRALAWGRGGEAQVVLALPQSTAHSDAPRRGGDGFLPIMPLVPVGYDNIELQALGAPYNALAHAPNLREFHRSLNQALASNASYGRLAYSTFRDPSGGVVFVSCLDRYDGNAGASIQGERCRDRKIAQPGFGEQPRYFRIFVFTFNVARLRDARTAQAADVYDIVDEGGGSAAFSNWSAISQREPPMLYVFEIERGSEPSAPILFINPSRSGARTHLRHARLMP
jgi:hypothetical protein